LIGDNIHALALKEMFFLAKHPMKEHFPGFAGARRRGGMEVRRASLAAAGFC
jgi:hypothetical protein